MKQVLALLSTVALSSCAIAPRDIPGKMYDMRDGATLEAAFTWEGKASGPTRIFRQAETCTGEYRTIMEGRTVGWGGLFGTQYSANSVERAQKGFALATCPSGMTFECEYVTNLSAGGVTGHGACKDNRGTAYRLMF